MKTICDIVCLPITIIICIVSVICVMILDIDKIVLFKNNKISQTEIAQIIIDDINHFFIYEYWNAIYPFMRASIAVILYYVIFY